MDFWDSNPDQKTPKNQARNSNPKTTDICVYIFFFFFLYNKFFTLLYSNFTLLFFWIQSYEQLLIKNEINHLSLLSFRKSKRLPRAWYSVTSQSSVCAPRSMLSAAMKPSTFSCRRPRVPYTLHSFSHDRSSAELNVFTATSSPRHQPLYTSPKRPFKIHGNHSSSHCINILNFILFSEFWNIGKHANEQQSRLLIAV